MAREVAVHLQQHSQGCDKGCIHPAGVQALALTPGKCHCKHSFQAVQLFLQAVAENSSSAKYNDKSVTSALVLRSSLLSLSLCKPRPLPALHYASSDSSFPCAQWNEGSQGDKHRQVPERRSGVAPTRCAASDWERAPAAPLTDNSGSD